MYKKLFSKMPESNLIEFRLFFFNFIFPFNCSCVFLFLPAPKFMFSSRFLLTIMATLGYCLQYMLKINLGIAIVCMVNNTAIKSFTNSNEQSFNLDTNDSYNHLENDQLCKEYHSTKSNSFEGEFIWSKSLQGFLLGSYFWGYIITQVKID